jgi:di/tripeptidase
MKKFKTELRELLEIQACSRQEYKVVEYLKPKLEMLVDTCYVDAFGNLLGEKKVGTGIGAEIVLSAHMDSVSNLHIDREVIYNSETDSYTSTLGVLGADDRAGIAIILSVLRNIEKTNFNGTLKIAFSCAEEIGCVGAGEIDVKWYENSNLAIVVDRRGNSDIVTGCGGMYNFCSKSVGLFFEDVSAMLEMDWKAVAGGVSDATVFSGNGINSVNLSAGYMNEHTKDEIVYLKDCKKTITLIIQALSVIDNFYQSFDPILKSSYYHHIDSDSYYSSNGYYNFDEFTFFEKKNKYSKTTFEVVSDSVVITQIENNKKSKNEIWLDKRDFESMINEYFMR